MSSLSLIDHAMTLHRNGDLDAAIEAYRRLLSDKPADPLAWDGLATALRSRGDLSAALKAGLSATRFGPDRPQAWNNLGNTRAQMGDHREALNDYAQALSLAPDYADAWANRGMAEKRLGLPQAAARSLVKAAGLMPENAAALNTLGNLLFELIAFEDAATCYQRAVAAEPAFANAWNNLGNTRLQLLQPDAAVNAYAQALAQEPHHAEAGNGFAQALLMSGDFQRGWPAYEARFKKTGTPVEAGALPTWRGEPLSGRTLYLCAEQGLGDTIQFLRFARHIKRQGARVVLECPQSLHTLARTVDGIDAVVGADNDTKADFFLPLMSLPSLLGLSAVNDISMSGPYIRANRSLSIPQPPRRIGLVWSGNPEHSNDHNRSMPLARLAPLLQITGIDCVSLQQGAARAQLLDSPFAERLPELSPGFASFMETARALDDVDVLITVDTSIAHLAGAMGHPCWLMLPYVPDWRWQTSGDTTPWYPSLRLFRQPQRGDWQGLVQQLVRALQGDHKNP